ncbi:tail assembly protein [Shewanella phage vB_SspS_KASIA]|nr:tail assembly protein [Shewanella phage vB_SspS_KASIA]
MKQPRVRKVYFHGTLADKYHKGVLEIGAESMTTLFRILFKNVFTNFLNNEKHFVVVFEDSNGNFTELFDPEQVLTDEQVAVHIMPNPDGAWVQIVYAIIVAIVAIGVALLLAPKIDFSQDTASGANWQSPENVIGQGGATPVLLGTRLVGSRVVSHGIDSTLYSKYKPTWYGV